MGHSTDIAIRNNAETTFLPFRASLRLREEQTLVRRRIRAEWIAPAMGFRGDSPPGAHFLVALGLSQQEQAIGDVASGRPGRFFHSIRQLRRSRPVEPRLEAKRSVVAERK